MKPQKIHSALGLVILLPLLGWICTGVIFLIKPGYAGAYEKISPKLYAIENAKPIAPKKSWTEVRFFRTILGNHLLVKVGSQWLHLNSDNFEPRPKPSEKLQILLLSDAISSNRERYGTIEYRQNDIYTTSTGVELRLNWNTLSISQKGNDTKLIGLLYKIHYLQWLGHKQLNIVLGVMGLLSLSLLLYYGILLYLRKRAAKIT